MNNPVRIIFSVELSLKFIQRENMPIRARAKRKSSDTCFHVNLNLNCLSSLRLINTKYHRLGSLQEAEIYCSQFLETLEVQDQDVGGFDVSPVWWEPNSW